MSSDQRVVIKSSWKSLAASAGYVWLLLFVLVGTLGVVGAVRSLALYVVLIVVFPFVVAVLRATQYLELTPGGLEIHGFSSTTTLEWPFVGSVDCVTKGSGGYLTVEDLFANRSRTLPAPRAVGEAGLAEAEQARELIEQWRLAHGGQVPPAATATALDPVEPSVRPAVDAGAAVRDAVVSEDDQWVVIRCSWKICSATVVPIGIILLIVQASTRSVGLPTFMLAWLAVVIVQLRFFEYIELNPQGVRIHGFRGTTVPWLSVGAVDYVPQLGGMGHLKIQDLTAKRRRRLTAPRVVLGMGKDETERARDLIERWTLAQCGPDPVPAAHPAPVPPVVDLDLA